LVAVVAAWLGVYSSLVFQWGGQHVFGFLELLKYNGLAKSKKKKKKKSLLLTPVAVRKE
jgi:hypothetical protein